MSNNAWNNIRDTFGNMTFNVLAGYIIGCILFVIVGFCCFTIGDLASINILIACFGGVLGWIVGILATPLDSNETAKFSSYTAAISTFLTGFLVAKLDRLFELSIQNGLPPPSALGQYLIFGTSFGLGALFTFIGRLYLGPKTPKVPEVTPPGARQAEGKKPGAQDPPKEDGVN